MVQVRFVGTVVPRALVIRGAWTSLWGEGASLPLQGSGPGGCLHSLKQKLSLGSCKKSLEASVGGMLHLTLSAGGL